MEDVPPEVEEGQLVRVGPPGPLLGNRASLRVVLVAPRLGRPQEVHHLRAGAESEEEKTRRFCRGRAGGRADTRDEPAAATTLVQDGSYGFIDTVRSPRHFRHSYLSKNFKGLLKDNIGGGGLCHYYYFFKHDQCWQHSVCESGNES